MKLCLTNFPFHYHSLIFFLFLYKWIIITYRKNKHHGNFVHIYHSIFLFKIHFLKVIFHLLTTYFRVLLNKIWQDFYSSWVGYFYFYYKFWCIRLTFQNFFLYFLLPFLHLVYWVTLVIVCLEIDIIFYFMLLL